MGVTEEQILGTLNAGYKDLLRQYYYMLFKCLELAKRTKESDISRFLLRNLYIHSSVSTMMGKFVKLKQVSG